MSEVSTALYKFFEVLLPQKWSRLYTYRCQLLLKEGDLVWVQVRGKRELAVVAGEALERENVLEITEAIGQNIGPLGWIKSAAEANLCEPGEILRLCLKRNYKKQISAFWFKANEYPNGVVAAKIRKGSSSEFKYYNNLNLNEKQQIAFQSLWDKISFSESKPILLKGPTGSGKSAVYFALIEKLLADGKQILLLMPEISLTESFGAMISEALGFFPHLWNHKSTDLSKQIMWDWAESGTAGLLVGSRSALWLPFKNLGCIILDEEHDQSYKQENAPRYHAREIALLRCEKVVMVSATPSLEVWLQVKRGKFDLVQLSGKQPINAKIVKRRGWLSEELKYAIYDTLDRGEQVLLFFNRRGFASSVICRKCKTILECDYCSSKVIYHRSNLTHCSYCGHGKPLDNCKNCSISEWDFYGIGIEKIEQEARLIFPKAKILTLSSETQDLPGKLAMIHDNEVNLIIATQILSKGHNFRNLTLVGIIQGDQGANAGDPRCSERIYQLMSQVRGRCGRAGIASRVIIQASDVENSLLKAVIKNDFDEWSERELSARYIQKLPPYFKLIRLIIGSTDPQKSRIDAHELYEYLKVALPCAIFPPAQTPLYKYKSSFRYSMLIRLEENESIHLFLLKLLSSFKFPNKSTLLTDVDPYMFY